MIITAIAEIEVIMANLKICSITSLKLASSNIFVLVYPSDVFDALLHRRPYKEPWPYADVERYIRERAGSQFDPEVVTALFEVVAESPELVHTDG